MDRAKMYITHDGVALFAEEVVNLPSEHADHYGERVKNLSKKLEEHIKDNPDYHFKRMMLSGSLAKRTSLRTISDADMALYIKSDDAPEDMVGFLEWLVNELKTLYRNIESDDIKPKTYSVSISFNDLDVDVVPIYWRNNKWDGELISQDDGGRLCTNIPKHLEFMQKRHEKHSPHFRQVIRLLKYWANERKVANENFRFKSFMIELIVAYLADKGELSLDSYPEALREFFDYLHISNLDEVISFNDFGHGSVNKQDKPINIFDPVNDQNNIAKQYTQQDKKLILEAAMEAADAIEYASSPGTPKAETMSQWYKIFGSSFRI